MRRGIPLHLDAASPQSRHPPENILSNWRWDKPHQDAGAGGIGGLWEDRGVQATDAERELYERVHNAASEAEGEGDAQLRAAVAAAQILNQAVVAPTHLHWSLRFQCDRLESAYQRKSATNSECYDCLPLFFKTALCFPHLLVILTWLPIPTSVPFNKEGECRSSSRPEFSFHDLWSICSTITCLIILGVQLIWPLWYRKNRGITLQCLVIALWAMESAKLAVSVDDGIGSLLEVAFLNVFMSLLHRVAFVAHCQLRSYGGLFQAVAIVSKAVDGRFRIQILCLALVGHFVGLALAYGFDRHSRKQFLRCLPAWLVSDHADNASRPPGGLLSHGAPFPQQLLSMFSPDGDDNVQPPERPPTVLYRQQQMGTRRALGGFAGGFGGVGGLKSTVPIYSNLSPPSTSSSLSLGGSSDSSFDDWGTGQTSSGISSGETPATMDDFGLCTTSSTFQWRPPPAPSYSSDSSHAEQPVPMNFPSIMERRVSCRGGGLGAGGVGGAGRTGGSAFGGFGGIGRSALGGYRS